LIEFKIVVLLALLVTNVILINKFYKFLRKAIKIRRIIKSFKLNILNKIIKCKVKEKFRNLKFCCSINLKSIIKFTKLSNCLLIDLVIIK